MDKREFMQQAVLRVADKITHENSDAVIGAAEMLYDKIEALCAPVDGWIEWDGSADKPVTPFAFVEYRMRNGNVMTGWVDKLNWSHDPFYATHAFQITAFRPVSP